jgi:hypothetical protein
MQEPLPEEVKKAKEVLARKDGRVTAHLEELRRKNMDRWATFMHQLEANA